jgi:hypothetical protein
MSVDGSGPAHLGADGLVVLVEANGDVLGLADDVRVGDDRPVRVDDEARAGRGPVPVARIRERRVLGRAAAARAISTTEVLVSS